MTQAEARERFDLSRRTIGRWERSGMPGASDDKLAILGGEISVLEGIALAHPSLAGEVEALIERYHRMMLRVQLGA